MKTLPHLRWLMFAGGSTLIVALLCAWGVNSLRRGMAPNAVGSAATASESIGFIGSARCATCHSGKHESYAKTAHRLAFDTIRLDSEPRDGVCDDPKMQRHYRIYRQDGQLRHEESIQTSTGKSLIVADYAMKYVVGSGRFSRSYVLEQDGYLFESPVTWYAARSAWGLSPGYEHGNVGFQRPIDLRCIRCHIGRAEPIDSSPQRLDFKTMSIDCERCHGPGEKHAEKWDEQIAGKASVSQADDTIVHPGRLDRERSEDICMQCHLQTAAVVERPGRSLDRFRPGDRLRDYAIHFTRASTPSRMEVAGHGEQMRLSRCYLQTETMTCITCHDPHVVPSVSERFEWYRTKCLACHTESACGLPLETRRSAEGVDDCVGCHMPTTPTEIPHFAFTHHRIAIHDGESELPADSGPATLVPVDSPSDLAPEESLRNLALAYLQFSDTSDGQPNAEEYRQVAKELLDSRKGRWNDPEVAAALARLNWGRDPIETIASANTVRAADNPSLDALSTANYTHGSTLYHLDRPAEAVPWLQAAVAARPNADIWIMLSDCLDHSGDVPAAIAAAQRAVQLAPDRPWYLQRLQMLESSAGKVIFPSDRDRLSELQEYWNRVRASGGLNR